MVQAMININECSNKILNIIKAMHSLKNKSEAIDFITKDYGDKLLQPELQPEFVKEFKKHLDTAKYDKHSSVDEMFNAIESQ